MSELSEKELRQKHLKAAYDAGYSRGQHSTEQAFMPTRYLGDSGLCNAWRRGWDDGHSKAFSQPVRSYVKTAVYVVAVLIVAVFAYNYYAINPQHLQPVQSTAFNPVVTTSTTVASVSSAISSPTDLLLANVSEPKVTQESSTVHDTMDELVAAVSVNEGGEGEIATSLSITTSNVVADEQLATTTVAQDRRQETEDEFDNKSSVSNVALLQQEVVATRLIRANFFTQLSGERIPLQGDSEVTGKRLFFESEFVGDNLQRLRHSWFFGGKVVFVKQSFRYDKDEQKKLISSIRLDKKGRDGTWRVRVSDETWKTLVERTIVLR